MKKSLLLSLFLLLFILLHARVEATSVPDPANDTSGANKEAAQFVDITTVQTDCVGSEIAVAYTFASDPYAYLLTNPAATLLLTTRVNATFEEQILATAIKISVQSGCAPEVNCEPEGDLVVFDIYETKSGYQIRMDVIKTPSKVLMACAAVLDNKGSVCGDEVPAFDVTVREEGEIELQPAAPKARDNIDTTNRTLNRDKYSPPKGGYGPADSPQDALDYLNKAREALAANNKDEAWEYAENAILSAPDYKTKFEARDIMVKAGSATPIDIQEHEHARVQIRIGQERERYYRELKPDSELGEIAQIKLYHKNADEFGLSKGALEDYEKRERDYLLGIATAKDESIEAVKEKGGAKALKKEAQDAEARGEFEKAYRLYYNYMMELMVLEKKPDSITDVDEWMKALGVKILNSTPKEDMKLLDDAVNHPAWERLAVFPSRHFIFIVPKAVESRVTKESMMRLDIAFTFEADFFCVTTRKYEERVTIFLKELWGFRGGTGGGNSINIGYKWAVENHNPAAVDSMLYTHELGHCMTVGYYWFLFKGFTEGIANMAMMMAEDCIGRHASSAARMDSNIRNGKHYFIDRNIPCWRVQNYDPAFTVMCGLLRNKPLVNGAFDWARMRGSMHDFLYFPIRPKSVFEYAWAWVKSLEPYFGEEVYAYYGLCKFPLHDKSKTLLQDDLDYYNADFATAQFGGVEALLGLLNRIEQENPRSYYRSLVEYKLLASGLSNGDEDLVAQMYRKLGIVPVANVLGPYSEGASEILAVLPPEEEIKLNAEYRTYRSVARWETNEANAEGFFTRRADYWGNWAGYTLTYVYVTEDTEAVLWIRAKLKCAAWINNRLVEKVELFDRRAWDTRSDFAAYPVKLVKGWNKLLGRFGFNSGEGMLRMRLTDRNGGPIEGIQFETADHEKDILPFPRTTLGSELFEDTFDSSSSLKRWTFGSGKFYVKSGKLHSENGRARKFRWVVVPDEKRDPDPAILWAKCPALEKNASYRVEIEAIALKDDLPKLYITLDGATDDDICSGISIHLSPERKGFDWTLCHYDTKYYNCMIDTLKKAKEFKIVVEKVKDLFSLTINDTVIFKNLSLPTASPGTLGLAFMEESLCIDSVLIRALNVRKGK